MTEPLPVHLHIHVEPPAPDPMIAEILSMVTTLTGGVTAMASELDDLTAKVEENTAIDQSAITLLNGLKTQLDAAIAANDPAALTALSNALGSSSAALAAAVAANTPADPNAPQVNPL